MSDWAFLNRHRLTTPRHPHEADFCSTPADGFNGFFRFTVDGRRVKCIVSDGEGWQHVSVSCDEDRRLPTWGMMCRIKDLFWEPEDWVIQFHPAQSQYVNNYPCLHLWRPVGVPFPVPPSLLVGIKELGELTP